MLPEPLLEHRERLFHPPHVPVLLRELQEDPGGGVGLPPRAELGQAVGEALSSCGHTGTRTRRQGKAGG